MQWEHSRTNFDRNLAVVIGIDRYDSRGIHDLQTAVSDANAIANLLRDEYGYKDEHIVRLFSPKNDEATLKALNQPYRPATLKELRILLTDTLPNHLNPTPADRLLLYFAGHGIPRNSKDGPAGYLVPQTAEQGNPASFLPMRELHDALSKLECHHLLVILDCCFAGTFRWASSRKAIPILETVHKEHYDRFIRYPAWQVLTSAAHDQEALDLSIDQRGSAIKDTRHSPFALALIEGLRDNKADVIQDKVITAHELYLYLDRRVNELSREMQTPGIYPMRLDYDRGEYVFTRPGFNRDDLTEAPPLNEENNPYRGLKPFEERHSRFFFGRKALVEALSHRLAQSHRPLTVVLGASGSGKSSLVKAGLLPHLREKQEKEQQAQRWYILDPMRPGKSPFTELARTLLPVANSNLIAQLAQVSLLDKAFAEILDPNSEQKQKAASPHPTQSNSREGLSGDDAFDATKLAECWNHAEPEAKLQLVVDYFAQLQGFCRQPQEQEQVSSLYGAIEQALNRLTQAFQQEPQSFTDLMATWSQANPSTKLLLVIDQFEELITLSQDERGSGEQSDLQVQDEQKEWQRFLSLLRIALAKYRRQLHVVLTLRSDFEPRFLNSVLKAHWKSARFPVRAMNSDELRDAIEGPALKQALYFEPPELVGRLIDEVGQMPGALPLLSFTLSELYIKLYERWTKDKSTDRALRIKDYEELGGVAGALTRRATEEYDNLVRDFGEESGKSYQATMQRVMLRMVTIEGGETARRRVPESELVYPNSEENKRVAQVIERLVKARLLVKGQNTGEPYVEPAHDYLVQGWDKLFTWKRNEEEENLLLQNQLTPAAVEWNRERLLRFLWNANPRLDLLKKVLHSQDNWLNQVESEFVQQSLKRKQFNSRLRWGIAFTTIGVLSIAVIFALIGQRQAQIEQTLALRQSAEANLRSNLGLDALIESLRAAKSLNQPLLQIFKTARNTQIQNEVRESLQKSLYQVREFNRLQRHMGSVPSSSFSPDGKLLASAGDDGTIRLWNLQGQQLQEFRGHQGIARNLSFSPDGKLLASAGDDGTIRLWNLQGQQLQEFRGHQGEVYSVNFSPTRNLLASSGTDGTVRLWNLQGRQLLAFRANTSAVPYVIFSPDGKLLATAGNDGIAYLWTLKGQKLAKLRGHQKSVWRIKFSPDGQYLATAGLDGTARLWNLQGKQLRLIKEHQGEVWSVSFSLDGKQLATGDNQGTVRLWSLQGQELIELKGHQSPVWSINFKPDNYQQLATSSADGSIRLWNLKNKELADFKYPNQRVQSVSFSPDGQQLATGDNLGTVSLWNLQGQLLKRFEDNQGSIWSISFSPDGQRVATGDDQGMVRLWNLQGKMLNKFKAGKKFLRSQGITFSPDGQQLATAAGDKIARLWDLKGQLLEEFEGHREPVYSVSFSRDGKRLVTGGDDHTARLWNLQSKQFALLKHLSFVGSVSFSPDGKQLATGDEEGIVRLWNLQGQKISEFKAHFGQTYSISFSLDGHLFATAGGDGTARLWNLQGQKVGEFQPHLGKVYSVSFNPVRQQLATAGNDDKAKLWQVESFEELIIYSCSWIKDYLETGQTQIDKNSSLCKI